MLRIYANRFLLMGLISLISLMANIALSKDAISSDKNIGEIAAQHAKSYKLDARTREKLVKEISETMLINYVFEEVAQEMGNDLKRRLSNGEYDAIEDAGELARKLTKDLRDVSHDQHIEVILWEDKVEAEPTSEEREKRREEAKQYARLRNSGIQKYELQDGNIGLLELNEFINKEFAEPTIVSTMALASNSDALIFDLRKSRGGDPETVALICSFLLGGEKVHLNDMYFRRINLTNSYWTEPQAKNLRIPNDKPVYVLTSRQTFSAAEEFAYDLQSLGRAIIIGERTRGGAHFVNRFQLNESFAMYTPIARPINPITKTNWEGAGVIPNIEVPVGDALKEAKKHALRYMIEREQNLDRKSKLKQSLEQL